MRQAYTKSIKYIPGEYAYTNGHSGCKRDHYNKSMEDYVAQRECGWASEWKPSKIIVNISTEDGYSKVEVNYFFKEHWGRLTEKRIQAIIDSLPDIIIVNEKIASSGTVYYTVDDSSLFGWLEKAMVAYLLEG